MPSFTPGCIFEAYKTGVAKYAESVKSTASRNCGICYENYQLQINSALTSILARADSATWALIVPLFDPDEIEYAQNPSLLTQEHEELGLCPHGFEPDYCPCGCGG
ncbi:hypothetical protein BFV94_4315 [Alteromonas macleodii]|uniref:Uncharacterized protein n=1 Tax=Alteromonas macleodii TaxID=28108 RepID=A0AB36FNZ9_ALTMA|nr:hypothetical protein BFV93_4703 [Alteromonas macleodii]OES25789.1 hypothetical protein BFV94_4315 [Alteromonas macleodii]OES25870.1 hypothetical protein BFV95_4258 [Alteromonas macleodii]